MSKWTFTVPDEDDKAVGMFMNEERIFIMDTSDAYIEIHELEQQDD